MIKRATLDDYELAYSLAQKFIQTQYGKWSNDEKVKAVVYSLLVGNDKCFFLYKDCGFIAGVKTQFLLGIQDTAVEIGWWLDPDKRGTGAGKELMDAFEDWAVKENCKLITMISIDDSVGKYYEKRGYKLYERTYMKEI